MKLTEKLIYFCLTLCIILLSMTTREDYVAFFNYDITIKKGVSIKNNTDISIKGSIEGEKFCLDNSCITGEDISRINKMPEKLKTSICLDSECIRKEHLYYLKDVWPEGAIVAYTGTISDIPDGWSVCDGKNHLPDLRDRFILGTNVNQFEKGGEKYVTLKEEEMPAHWHQFYTHDIDRHNSDTTAVHTNRGDTYKITNNDIHLGPTSPTGKSKPHNNMPPFYKLIYIIRVKSIDFILDILRYQIKRAGGIPVV